MKHLCILLLFSAAAALSAAASKPAEAAKPAATAASKPAEAAKPVATAASKPAEAAKPAATAAAKPAEAKPASVLTSLYHTEPDPSSFADPEKAESLLKRRAELVQKIQDERKRLLQEDTAAKKLRDEILLLNRKLASLLETKKSMIELNSQLRDLDIAVSRLKPAPQPKKETEDADKTDKAGKTDKADKE